MALTNNSTSVGNQGSGVSIAYILTSMQQGVTAINNVTRVMATIFPSS